MKLLFATNNPGKKAEISALGKQYGIEVLMLSDLNISSDPEETGETFEENAELKLRDILENYEVSEDIWVAADDSGAKIPALNGEPGVYTARWPGKKVPYDEMVEFILNKTKDLKGEDRGAEFVSVVALAKPGGEISFFEGKVEGQILEERRSDLEPMDGFPWRELFYQLDAGKMLGEEVEVGDRTEKYLTHREKAFTKVFEFITS